MTADWLQCIKTSIMHLGLPLVHGYHALCASLFLNTAAIDSSGLERVSDNLLAPTQYVLGGYRAVPSDTDPCHYEFCHRFTYGDCMWVNTVGSLVLMPVTLPLGFVCKSISYISPSTRNRYKALKYSANSRKVISNNEWYREVGLQLRAYDECESCHCQGYQRRPGDENNLKCEKEALQAICSILTANDIPFWCDCGTCLGAYRYGGVIPWDEDVDLAILAPDFDNVKRALNALDRRKYAVQDWSSRDKQKSYLKVYVKRTHALIDIYVYSINTQNNTLAYILSNEDNIFLTERWRARERKYKEAVPFDMIFPVKMAQFDNFNIPVPNQTEAYLKVRYGENIGPVRLYNEHSGRYEKDLTHPYWNEINTY